MERRRPILPPKSPIPPDPSPGFFSEAFEALPIPLLVSILQQGAGGEAPSPSLIKNAAYRQAFCGKEDEAAVDAFFRG